MQTRACYEKGIKRRLSYQLPLDEKVLLNARRLMGDSALLADSGSIHSAIVLGVLAIEELGKYLIERWGVKNKANKREFPTHIEKQSATFALVCASYLIKRTDKVRKYLNRGSINFLKLGGYSEQFAWCRSGFYDEVRMACTYADRDPKIPDALVKMLKAEFPRYLQEVFDDAINDMNNSSAMEFAAELYRNDLGRL